MESRPPYSRAMSRWEVAPTDFQRWIARHRTGLVRAELSLVALSLLLGVYAFVTDGGSAGLGGVVGGVAGSLTALIATRSVAGYVDEWDRKSAPTSRVE